MAFSMTTDKGIFIQNIYYMLSYAYQVLQQQDYQCIASEKFERIDDLFAAILAKGVSRQLKQGLYREYVSRSETRSVLRGKLDLPQTIKTRIQHKPQVACTFDELSEDNLYNQILKTTLHVLLRDKNVSTERKVELKKALLFLDTVSALLPSQIPWKQLHYQRSNQNYEMLLNLCYFVLHDKIIPTLLRSRLRRSNGILWESTMLPCCGFSLPCKPIFFCVFAKKFSFWMPSITARHCSSSLIKRPCILPTSTRSTPTLKIRMLPILETFPGC